MNYKDELDKKIAMSIAFNSTLGAFLLVPILLKWEEFQLLSGKWTMIFLFVKAIYDIIYYIVWKKEY